MSDWNPLHRDAKWPERISRRAEANSREIDRMKLWVAWLGLAVGIGIGMCLYLFLTR